MTSDGTPPFADRASKLIEWFLDRLGRYPSPVELRHWDAMSLAHPQTWQNRFQELVTCDSNRSKPADNTASGRALAKTMDLAETDCVWIDITQTLLYPYQTGIQKLVRGFAANCKSLKLPLRFYTVDLESGQPFRYPGELSSFQSKSDAEFANQPGAFSLLLRAVKAALLDCLKAFPVRIRNQVLSPLANRSAFARACLKRIDRLKSSVRRRRSSLSSELGAQEGILRFQKGSRILALELISEESRAQLAEVLTHQGVELTLMIHDLLPLEFPHTAADPIGFLNHLGLIGNCARIAVYPGYVDKAKALLKALGHNGAPLPEVRSFIPGPGTGGHQHSAPLSQARPAEQNGVPLILCVGTIEPRKNQSLLLRAALALLIKGQAFRLVIVGQPGWKNQEFYACVRWFEEEVRSHCAKAAEKQQGGLPLPEKEILVVKESVPQEELNRLYQEAGVVVLPSLGEGYGLPVLEALACGKPVLASTGIPKDGFSPLLLSPTAPRLEFFDPLDVSELARLLERHLREAPTPHPGKLDKPGSSLMCSAPEAIWNTYTHELFRFALNGGSEDRALPPAPSDGQSHLARS